MRIRAVLSAKPNVAHKLLAKLESMGLLKAVITQNVDGLHKRAGSVNVIELHGNILKVKCINASCNYASTLNATPSRLPPTCPKCGSLLRPGVVWFGEQVPSRAWMRALIEAETCDVMLVIGTSGVVMPAAMLPVLAKKRGAKIIEVNPESTALSSIADVKLRMKAGEFAREVARLLNIPLD